MAARGLVLFLKFAAFMRRDPERAALRRLASEVAALPPRRRR